MVMIARKKRKSNTSYYTITGVYRETEHGPEEHVELGKVRQSEREQSHVVWTYIRKRSNFLGTTFVIYSHGRNPLKREMAGKKKDLPVREELGAVLYVSLREGLVDP